MSYKKTFLQTHTDNMLKASCEVMRKKIKELIDSGAIDVESYDTENNPFILPKAIIIALLETEAEQYKAKGTKFEKEVKKNVKNFKAFI